MRTLPIALLVCATLASASPCKFRGRSYSYAYSFDNHKVAISSGTTLEDFTNVRPRLGNNFLWARLEGKTYVIRDEEFLRRARELFAPLRALEPQVAEIEREEERLDAEIDKLADDNDASNDAQIQPLQAKLDEVHRRERALDKREEQLSCDAEAKLWPMIEDAIRSGLGQPMTR